MEGLAGIVYPDVFQMNSLIQPMLSSMKHRGKDPIDIYNYKNIQIGVCGNKLASNENKTIFLGIDGTIENAKDIKEQLLLTGIRFHQDIQEEILIKAYEFWDTSFLEHLSGDFAIIILDHEKKKLILARDRIGKKPLYWYHEKNHFIFASELKALLATGLIPQTPALDALGSYLYFGYIPQDLTPIAKINKLLPAYYLTYNWDGSKYIDTYWSFSSYFENTFISPKTEIIQQLDHLLRESVKRSLPKDKKYGCALSGGLGSASIAYYANEFSHSYKMPTFTVGFQGENERDLRAAVEAGKALGLEQEVYEIQKSNFIDDFVKIAWFLDEPLADPNVIATWKLAEMTSHGAQTLLSGMGSDELFGGHNRYSIEEQDGAQLQGIMQNSTNWLFKRLTPLMNAVYKPAAYKLIKKAKTNPGQFNYFAHNALFNEKMIAQSSPKLAENFTPEMFFHRFHRLPRINSLVSSYLYFDIKTRLPDCYILQYERLTAAFGLDWNAPYLDKALIEFAASLPEPQELIETETAYYLKAIFEDIFPPSFINRPKKTRKNFLKDWIESNEMQKIFKLLPTGSLVDAGLVSSFWIQNKIEDLGRDPNAFRYVWTIFAMEVWFRLYITNPIQTTPPEMSVYQLLSEPL